MREGKSKYSFQLPLTLSSTIAGSTPKKGIMGKAGFSSRPVGAGRGVIIIPPVSTRTEGE